MGPQVLPFIESRGPNARGKPFLSRCELLCPVDGSLYLEESYCPHYILARGSLGTVWVCSDKRDGTHYACKSVRKHSLSQQEMDNVKTEVELHSYLSSRFKGIVRLKDAFETDDMLYLILELCRGGDLFRLLERHGRLPEASAKALFRQVALAVAFCHNQGVIHRDIKPENILLDRDGSCLYSSGKDSIAVGAKLADFGHAVRVRKGGTARGLVGSNFYTAPEMISKGSYGFEVDVWSLGVVLHAMLSGRLPFSGNDLYEVQSSIQEGHLTLSGPSWLGVSSDAKDLVRSLLVVEPASRLSASQTIQHPWLRGGQAALSSGRKPLFGSFSSASHSFGSCNSVESESSCISACSGETRSSSCSTDNRVRASRFAYILEKPPERKEKLGVRLLREMRRRVRVFFN